MRLTDELTKIADAIRGVFGFTGKIKFTNFAKEIKRMCYIGDDVTGRVYKVDVNTPNLYIGNNGLITATTNQETGYVSANTKTRTYQLPTVNERDIIPSALGTTIEPGVFVAGRQNIIGDVNLTSDNIVKGKSIFGVNGNLDRIKRIEQNKVSSSYHGEQACDVARSYHLARLNGSANFKYSQKYSVFNGKVTSPEGYCYLDCSGFIGLVLRGIDYNHSPFVNNAGTSNATCSPSRVSELCESSTYQWADKFLDKQTHSDYFDLGIKGFKSIRNSAQIGEYFYSRGCTLYEYEIGKSPSSVPEDLKPGDLVFWSKPQASENQKLRFKSISHVGIVAHKTDRYYEATGSESSKGNTVFYSNLTTDLEYITLIVRPNYNPVVVPVTPANTNLLASYYFDSIGADTSTVINGVTFTSKTDGGLTLKGIASEGTTFYLRKKEHYITLEPGTYQLSGCPVHPDVDSSSTSTKWGLVVRDINGVDYIGYDRGKGATFTLSDTKKVYVYIYVSATLKKDSTFNFSPKLIKTK